VTVVEAIPEEDMFAQGRFPWMGPLPASLTLNVSRSWVSFCIRRSAPAGGFQCALAFLARTRPSRGWGGMQRLRRKCLGY
jgi:hypothetical protein